MPAYYRYDTRRREAPAVTLDDGREVQLPTRWAICSTCRGRGKHSHRLGAMSAEEFYGPDWDDDDREAYKSGFYDERCEPCAGTGKVQEVDEEACKPELLALYREEQADIAEMDAIYEAERRMGA